MHCDCLKVWYRNQRKHPVNSSVTDQKQFDAVILLFLVKDPFCIKQGVMWTVKSLNITIQICFFCIIQILVVTALLDGPEI